MSAQSREDLLAQVLAGLRRAGAADAAAAFFVPGRIEVLGKHTDYAGGRSLLAAVDRGFVVAAAARSDDAVRVIDAVTGASVTFAGDVEAAKGGAGVDAPSVIARAGAAATEPSWATYARAVVRRCALNFPDSRGGADIAFASSLPQAAGLSSSSALVVAVFLALDAVRGISSSPVYRDAIRGTEDLAGYLGAVENGLAFGALRGDAGVGTMGGSEDHTAILCARAGRLVQYSYAPVHFEREVPVPDGLTFAIAASGVRAEKAGAALAQYNRLSSSTRRLVELWRDAAAGAEPTLAAIVTSDPAAALRLREIVRVRAPAELDTLAERLAQFVAESEEIVPAASAALARGDVRAFGNAVQRSQHYAEHALHNQVPETTALVDAALGLGAAAASAFGAGFGGSVWALVPAHDAARFAGDWRASYLAEFPGRSADAVFFSSPAAGPASPIDLTRPRTRP